MGLNDVMKEVSIEREEKKKEKLIRLLKTKGMGERD